MGLSKLGAHARVFARLKSRGVPDLLRLLLKRPAILVAVGTYETALLASSRMDSRLKALAALKASSLIGCPF
jgi:alkylhydroperoxidase family enzyme